jgi:hypothetical protein
VIARPGWGGWGWPIAAGVAAGVAANTWDYGYDQCSFWNGFAWVNACYQPYEEQA